MRYGMDIDALNQWSTEGAGASSLEGRQHGLRVVKLVQHILQLIGEAAKHSKVFGDVKVEYAALKEEYSEIKAEYGKLKTKWEKVQDDYEDVKLELAAAEQRLAEFEEPPLKTAIEATSKPKATTTKKK